MTAYEIAHPAMQRTQWDHVPAAIAVLSLCEFFDVIAQGTRDGRGWKSHIEGSQSYLKHYLLSASVSPYGRLVFQTLWSAAFAWAWCSGRLSTMPSRR